LYCDDVDDVDGDESRNAYFSICKKEQIANTLGTSQGFSLGATCQTWIAKKTEEEYLLAKV
jgi:hypothetical protein